MKTPLTVICITEIMHDCTEKQTAIADLKSQVALLSIDIAQKVLQAELSNDNKQELYVESLLKDAKIN